MAETCPTCSNPRTWEHEALSLSCLPDSPGDQANQTTGDLQMNHDPPNDSESTARTNGDLDRGRSP